jgi:glycosyltransferase involved in cell wall biosynthesis
LPDVIGDAGVIGNEGGVKVVAAMSNRPSSLFNHRDLPSVSVVIPTLNEARNLPHVFAEMPLDIDEVIVVDGRSVDETVAVARSLRPDVRIVNQTRKGKGNALACGFAAATCDIIVMIDADCSTSPSEIPRFVSTLVHGADFAKGSRFAAGGGSGDITRLRSFGNRGLNGLVNLGYRTRFTDLCYGYNAIWRKHLSVLGLNAGEHGSPAEWGDGFEIETVMNIRVARAGLRIFEVPSYEQPRMHGASNLNAFSDGFRVLRTVMTERRRAHDAEAVAAAQPHRVIRLDESAPKPADTRREAKVIDLAVIDRVSTGTDG